MDLLEDGRHLFLEDRLGKILGLSNSRAQEAGGFIRKLFLVHTRAHNEVHKGQHQSDNVRTGGLFLDEGVHKV